MAMDQQLIGIVNRLQDTFNSIGLTAKSAAIDLPQICVVGSQSSGKSSVLENIVGRDFLPRGQGIVTRRPLVLQLINRPAGAKTNGAVASPKPDGAPVPGAPKLGPGENEDEWGEFLHLPGQKFYSFDEIRKEIIRDTELKTGKNAGISNLPINLRIYSPHVLTLTLVDLPGITKVPVGDQPKDIELQIRKMIVKYIEKPNSIILAVNAANQDLANSDGLKLAQEHDPDGQRTIGVLTKLDLMDQGTHVVDILAGRVIPLRLGYVPVVNRSQRDIDQSKAIQVALDSERSFFENHPMYSSKAQFCGTPFLAKKLNSILLRHIRDTLPDIKAKIQASLARASAELKSLGGQASDNADSALLSIITEFTTDFRTALDGNSTDLSLHELSGGARISFLYHELYANSVKSLDPLEQVQDGEIRTILYNSSGSSPAMFVSTAAFDVIIRQQIRRIEAPSLKCVTLTYDELTRLLTQILNQNQNFKRYPALKEKLYVVVNSFFKRALEPTNKLVKDLIGMESTYINSGHPDFISGHRAMAIVSDRMQAAKGPPPVSDPKSGKLAPGALNNNKDLDVTLKNDDNGFFASFWGGKPKNMKKGAAMLEPPPQQIKASGSLSERETMEVEVIKLLIVSYFNIVKRTLIDMVPKAIMLNLVQQAKDDLQRVLLAELYNPAAMDELMKESEGIVARRKELKQLIEALTKAEAICATV